MKYWTITLGDNASSREPHEAFYCHGAWKDYDEASEYFHRLFEEALDCSPDEGEQDKYGTWTYQGESQPFYIDVLPDQKGMTAWSDEGLWICKMEFHQGTQQ